MAISFIVLNHADINLDTDYLIKLIDDAGSKIDLSDLPSHEKATYYNMFGTALTRKNEELDRALEAFEKGVEIYPSPDNETIPTLMQVYVQLKQLDKFTALDLQYPSVVPRNKHLVEMLKEAKWHWQRKEA